MRDYWFTLTRYVFSLLDKTAETISFTKNIQRNIKVTVLGTERMQGSGTLEIKMKVWIFSARHFLSTVSDIYYNLSEYICYSACTSFNSISY